MLQQVQRLMAVGPNDIVIRPDVPVVPVVPVAAHDILWVQQSLNALGANPPLAEDGLNGPLTTAAVLQFQQANGLSPSGFADQATIAAIERKSRPTGPVPSRPTDLIALLERLVMLIEKLKGQRPLTDPSTGSSPTDRLRKTIELLGAILSPGARRQAAAARPGQRRARADHRQSARRQEDRDRPARRGGHAVAVACVRDDRARSPARHADAGSRPERLCPAGLPRHDRLGRARQDGEVGAQKRAAAELLIAPPAHSGWGTLHCVAPPRIGSSFASK